MNNQKLSSYLDQVGICYCENVSLKTKTWIKRGGIASFWIQPDSLEKLQQICTYCFESHIHFELVGYTSNLYFLNDFDPEVVISTIQVKHYEEMPTEISCECGVSITALADYCVKNGIEGYEGFIGLPGTVGAASYNNSGCYGSVLSDLLIRMEFLTENGDVIELDNSALEYTNRSSLLKRKILKGVILRCYLKKKITFKPELLRLRATENQIHRKKYGAGYKQNLGCVFASGTEHIVGRLPFCWRICYRLVNRLCLLFRVSLIKRLKVNKECLLLFYRMRRLSPYIADNGILYFLWKDEQADQMFWEYVKFYQRISGTRDLEIEIRGELKF